jgi:acetolactate synthase-1/2/3 large subunit
MRLSDYVFDRVTEAGVDSVFLVTGRGSLFLTDALAKNEKLKYYCMHNEQAAAYAANAYSQLKNDIGVCLVSTGCGSTNAITGVLTAWQDGLPVVFISGQNLLRETQAYTGLDIRTFGQQEANIVSIVKSITKYAVTVQDPKDIGRVIDQAFHLANSGKKGPVWIDIPLDIQSSRVEPGELEREHLKAFSCSPTSADLDILRSSLMKSLRPIVLIGAGVRSANAEDEFKKFIKINKIPVVYTGSAPDIYSLSNDLCVGSIGSMGCSRAGSFAVQNSDLVIVLGNRLNSLTTGNDFCKFARDATTIVVDIDTIEHSKDTIRIDHLIKADIAQILKMIGSDKMTKNTSKWVDKVQYWKSLWSNEPHFQDNEKVDLYEFSRALSVTLDGDCNVVTDSGFIEVILPTNMDFAESRRSIHPYSQGAMGYSIPGAIGAFAVSKKQLVVVVGDGSFMMNMQELETIRHHDIPVKLFVINNNVYSIIERRQKELFRRRTIGTSPCNGVTVPNFEKVADIFDMKYCLIDSPNSMEDQLSGVLANDGPVLCEVMGRLDQQYVEVANSKTSTGKFVRRPLEDQWPFMDRELLITEMLIEPIDL